MGESERGRAAGATPDYEHDDAPDDRPREPPPPGFLDLGNGRMLGAGAEVDLRAAAAWLDRNYPERSQDPPTGHTGPIYAMSNYRVRQVLGLGPMPERQLRLLIALATWMNDDTRTVRVGLETLITESGKSHNTVRNARRELEAGGKLASEGGRGKGNLTVWTALCLPEKGVSDVDPQADPKGTSEVGTFSGESKGTSDVDPFSPAGNPPKGTNHGSQKVPTEGSKRYQPQLADQREPEMGFNPRANNLGSVSLSAPACDDDAGTSERENDIGDEDEEEEDKPDPDFALLAAAVPGADWRDVEDAITTLQYRKYHGEIRTTVRAYLRKIIDNGDAWSVVNDAAAERRRREIDLARYDAERGERYDPFGGPITANGHQADPWAPVPANGAPVVAGEVIQPDADVRLTGVPETRTSVPPAVAREPVRPINATCPECSAEPKIYCRKPDGNHYAGWHAGRIKAAEEQRAEEEASQ